jgi:hypothetical protein
MQVGPSLSHITAQQGPKNATNSVAARAINTGAIALFGIFLLAAGTAQAQDVRWSVTVGSHAPAPQPVVVYPAPQVVYQTPQVIYPAPQVIYQAPQVVYPAPQVVYQPAPPVVVYQQPRVVYAQPRVVYQPQPRVVYQPQPVYYAPGQWRYRGHGGHGRGYDREDDRGKYNRTRVQLRISG